MGGAASAKALRATVATLGAVATAAGAHTLLAGARSVPGAPSAGPELESELRFYGAFYLAYGLTALAAAPRADTEKAALRSLAGTLFLGGLARLPAWRSAGTPDPAQRALLALELVLPPTLLAWQRALDTR